MLRYFIEMIHVYTPQFANENEIWVPIYQHGLTLVVEWTSNYIHYKMWGETTYSFLNVNDTAFEVWELMNNFLLHFTVITYSSCDYI